MRSHACRHCGEKILNPQQSHVCTAAGMGGRQSEIATLKGTIKVLVEGGKDIAIETSKLLGRIAALEAQLAAKDGEIASAAQLLEDAECEAEMQTAHASTLQSEVASLQRELAEAREWISVYGSHTATCEATKSLTNPRPCDCGLDTFRAKEKA